MRDAGQARLIPLLVLASLFVLIVLATNGTVNDTGAVPENSDLEGSLLNVTDGNVTDNVSALLDAIGDIEALPPFDGNVTNSTDGADDYGEVIEAHQEKFTSETKAFLKEHKNQERIFLVKYELGFDEEKLQGFSRVKHLEGRISCFEAKGKNLKDLVKDENVLYIELDQDIKTLGEVVPWNVERVGAATSWNATTGGGVTVAILDTGVAGHPDLAVSDGWNVVDDDSDYSDLNGHGTAVAGVVAATINDYGLVGVSPAADLVAVKIMDEDTGSLGDAIAGVEWARSHGADVILMSFGSEAYSQIFRDTLQDAADDGILLVAAAGNDGGSVLYPAAYSSVIAVGSVDGQNDRAGFSNYGPELELVAPGVDINTTALDGYAVLSGTSLAAPHVAGAAALLMAFNSGWSAGEIRGKLQADALDLGDAGRDDEYGYGLVRVNLSAAAQNATPLSYFYEIFNITDYGLPNETLAFWINGTGTIDDVEFAPGYYLVNRTINNRIYSQILNVSANGTISVLFIGLRFYDTWTVDQSSSADGTTWQSTGSLYAYIDDIGWQDDVECWDFENDGYDNECYFESTAVYNACNDALCPAYTQCEVNTIGLDRTIHTGVTRRIRTVVAYTYQYTGDGCTINDYDDHDYHVIDQKKNICTGNSYLLYGRYGLGTNEWVSYSGTQSCGSISSCDPSFDEQTCSSSACTPQTPCRRTEGNSCDIGDGDVSNDCYTGLTCIDSICTAPTNGTVDLAIVNIIPIQVIPGVDMVKDKSGYVVVNVTNYGTAAANGNVHAWFDGDELTFAGDIFSAINNVQNRPIAVNAGELFVFEFKPDMTGTNLVINASVEVVS